MRNYGLENRSEQEPTEKSPLLQVPSNKYRAVKTGIMPYNDLPDESCREKASCPAVVLITGNNRVFGESMNHLNWHGFIF